MRAAEILQAVGEQFPLIIRNEFHAQIQLAKKSYHNFWVTRDGLKVQLAGNRGTMMYYSPLPLIQRLKSYHYDDTDLAVMNSISRLIKRIGGREGVFCDAGYKDGKAKIAVIRMFGTEIDLHVRESEMYSNNTEAEIGAIRLAAKMFPNAPVIYSDSESAINQLKGEINNVEWIGRDNNNLSDHFANMRG